MDPKILVTDSCRAGAHEAVEELTAPLAQEQLPVRGAVIYCTFDAPVNDIHAELRRALGKTPFIGCTSCLGVGSTGQFLGRGQPAIAALWLLGSEVRLGTALLPKATETGEAAGAKLAQSALTSANIATSQARFALYHATPGGEEATLRGIAGALGAGVPLIGGTAADNDLSGGWALFTEQGVSTDGQAMAVCDWPGKIGVAYRGGYLPTTTTGKVTRSSGRIVHEIDGRPAAVVYNEWTRGAIAPQLEKGGNILRQSTLFALGVARAHLGNLDLHVLAHPVQVLVPDKSLEVFAEVAEGETLCLMQSSPTALVRRAKAVAEEAFRHSAIAREEVDAALMIYCAGCLLAITNRAPQMLADFRQAIAPAPALSAFTFGEQGCIVPERIDHGNLMCCVLLLSCKRP